MNMIDIQFLYYITYQDNEFVCLNEVNNIRTKKYKISSVLGKTGKEKLVDL